MANKSTIFDIIIVVTAEMPRQIFSDFSDLLCFSVFLDSSRSLLSTVPGLWLSKTVQENKQYEIQGMKNSKKNMKYKE